MNQTTMNLTDAQRKMLRKANRRYGKVSPTGEAAHFTSVAAGQAGAARALDAKGLGGYDRNGRFWINEAGHALAST